MKQQGHILVVGAHEDAEALVRDRQGDRYRFTCCARDNHTDTSASQAGQRYEWIVINGEVLDGDKTDLIQSLRAIGFFNDVGKPGCGVEWQPDGTLQLRCCMQAQARVPRTPTGQLMEFEAQGMVFEYHAPVKRTG